ncbi:MAG: peptidoglycan-binding protein [Clostridia bacterium]|nr:peptidoglycan-binding protein [Clostridia bacterium]
MPQTNNQRTEIYELQTMLRLLSQTDPLLPIINPDGIFGPETERAVLAFQTGAGLAPTGIVDFGTWTAITNAYQNALRLTRRGLALFPFPGGDYKVERGEESDLVYIIQIMLSSIDVAYDIFDDIDISGIYDEKTEAAIRIFQRINRLAETGIVDSTTWDRLALDHNRFALNPIYTG